MARTTILIADSDADFAAWLDCTLHQAPSESFDTIRVSTLAAAISKLSQDSVDLLVLGDALRDADEVESLTRARASAPWKPIVVVSGSNAEMRAVQALHDGADDFVVKGELDERGMVRVIRHALERKRAQQALQESEERYRRLAENAPDIIFRYELLPERRLAYVSPAVSRILGRDPEELYAGRAHASQIVHHEDLARLKAALGRPSAVGPVTARLQHRDGQWIWAELRVVPSYDNEGTITAVEGIVRDTTKRKEIEAQLLQSEKLRSLGVMASGVAHQMNNVLTSIMGNADLLLQDETEPLSRRIIESILHAAEDGAASVRRIQGLARTEPLDRSTPVDLVTILSDAVEATAPRWRDQAHREGIQIAVCLEAQSPIWVNGVTSELREVVMNLILNAVDALPAGGQIRIASVSGPDAISLSVTDDGFGMSEEVQQRVFDPFFTTKPFGKGTGLGLSLVYGIVKRHHGLVSLESQPGQGTCFEIRLPAVDPPEQASVQIPSAPASALRILVVDDHEALAEQLQTILQLDHHQVDICFCGSEAILALEREPFDLVITDLGMPGLNGWDVAREAKLRQPNLQVGLVTGWGAEIGDGASLRERSVDFVIAKPYRIHTIREAVALMAEQASPGQR